MVGLFMGPECKLLIFLKEHWQASATRDWILLATVMSATRSALRSIETIDLLWDRDQLGQLTYFTRGGGLRWDPCERRE